MNTIEARLWSGGTTTENAHSIFVQCELGNRKDMLAFIHALRSTAAGIWPQLTDEYFVEPPAFVYQPPETPSDVKDMEAI